MLAERHPVNPHIPCMNQLKHGYGRCRPATVTFVYHEFSTLNCATEGEKVPHFCPQSQGHHTIDHLDERSVERGSARHLPWKDERRPLSIRWTSEPFQRQCWGNFWETYGAHNIMGISKYTDTILNWTELYQIFQRLKMGRCHPCFIFFK